MTQKEHRSSIFRTLFMVGIILILPFLVSKVSNSLRNDGKIKNVNVEDEDKINAIISRYLQNHEDKVLSIVMNGYYEKYLGEKNSEKLTNAIVLYHKILFNEKLPKITSKVQNAPNIIMFFSDFDSAAPMLEKIHDIKENSQVNIYFRQIITQNKFSSVISRYGQAIFETDEKMFIPFYLSILKTPKDAMSEDKINSIVTGLELDLPKIQHLANSEIYENLTKENNDLAKKLEITQLPAWILENGRVLFGIHGFEIIQNLMHKTDENN